MQKNTSPQKYIYVVFSHPKSIVSETIGFFTGGEFTHCSLTLDRDLGHMFSFGRKYSYFPFIGCYLREELDKSFYSHCDSLRGRIVEIPVSDEQYANVKRRLIDFWVNKKHHKYNMVGFFFYLLNKDYAPDGKYTCSQFVAETLDIHGICKINKAYTLVNPDDLSKIVKGNVIFDGDIKKYALARKNKRFIMAKRKQEI